MTSFSMLGALLIAPVTSSLGKSAPIGHIFYISAFPLIWCSVPLLIAKVSGWQQLARFYGIEKYPARSRHGGGLHSIYVNGCRYKNAMTIQYDEDGLYLRPMIIFRLGHALLYVPWEDIAVQPDSEHRGFLGLDVTQILTFSAVPNVKIKVSKSLIETIERFRDGKMIDAV